MMTAFTPVRDEGGGIIGMRPQGDESQFSQTLADTMTAVGATKPAPEGRDTPLPVVGRAHLAGIVGGLVAALALVAALNLAQTPASENQARSAPAASTRTPAPTATLPPTSAPTATPEPPTPLPTPEPIVIVQPPIQCYTITLDVTDAHGTPIGIATGESCESREAAQANAAAQAEQVRAAHEGR